MANILVINHIHTYSTIADVCISLFQLNPFEQVIAWLLFTKVLAEELHQGLLQHAWPLLLQGLEGHTHISHHHKELTHNKMYKEASLDQQYVNISVHLNSPEWPGKSDMIEVQDLYCYH